MTMLQSILEAMLPNLTDNQKGLLISIHASATPQQAFDTANGTMMSISAKDQMVNMGLIRQLGNQLQLTDAGNESLLSNNLIDNLGTITPEGDIQLKHFENNKSEQVNTESFDLFKSFYQ
jgi:hypothetical protein